MTAPISAASRRRLGDRLVVASISGGKDSTALALLLREQGVPHVRVFADTGFEAPETYAYLDTLRERLGPITVVRNEALWASALPGEEGMLTLIRRKRMFPARLMRFCTEKLKLHPIREHVRQLIDRGDDVVNAVGVRAAESAARAAMAEWEFWDDMDVDIWRPLLRWSEQDVIAMHHRHGLAPNPLYLAGARRVGCNPCIHARKSDLRRLPESQLVKIRRVEDELTADAVARGCERPTRAFFQTRGEGGALQFTPIDEVVRLAGLHRGKPIVGDPEPAGCVRWGLCDAGAQEKPVSPAVQPSARTITRAELVRLGVSAEMIARYLETGVARPAGGDDVERTPELEKLLTERCNVGRGYLIAIGVKPATIATWLRRQVLVRTAMRGFYTLSRAAFESVRAAASGPGLPRELEGLADEPDPAPALEAAGHDESAPAPAPLVPQREIVAAAQDDKPDRLRVVPCTIKRAREFVRDHHRHHPPPAGGLFAVGLARGGELAAVAIVGRPVARALQDGATAEITRLCSRGERNACSMLLAACRRTAAALGYRRVITYTLASEPGTSLRAAGWHPTATVRAGPWSRRARPRQAGVLADKRRWEPSPPPSRRERKAPP